MTSQLQRPCVSLSGDLVIPSEPRTRDLSVLLLGVTVSLEHSTIFGVRILLPLPRLNLADLEHSCNRRSHSVFALIRFLLTGLSDFADIKL